ncbi:MAG: hypothetical protein WCO66_02335 [Candidatus Absconditabacteria bacterium]
MKLNLPFIGVLKMTDYTRILLLVFSILVIQELVILILKRKWRKQYLSPEVNPTKSKNNENYLIYYKKYQVISTIRALVLIFATGFILAESNQNFWSFFAIGIGAIIITFQPMIQSIIVYFTVLLQYTAGDTIRIGDKQGEIISIKPLMLGISGMTDNGEHDGNFYLIPNKVIFESGIQKISLRAKNIQKVMMTFVYTQKIFGISFDDTLFQLETFLTELLPQRSMAEVGYFKSYSGHRYKLNFDLSSEKEGGVFVTITFLEKLGKMREVKRQIVSFIESIKK